ncbi:MAG: hypothetical protein ACRD4C_05055 [Candidatus Acidiferrales bacterium]
MNQMPILPNYYTPEDAGILASMCLQTLSQQTSRQRGVASGPPEQTERCDIEPEFNRRVREWKRDRNSSSLSSVITSHPAYLRIIGMGPDALPLVLRELEKELDHWFVALQSISGEDPVPDESRGDMMAMTRSWVEWGRKKGYVR